MGPALPRADGRLKEAAGVPAWKPCLSNDCRQEDGREGWISVGFLESVTKLFNEASPNLPASLCKQTLKYPALLCCSMLQRLLLRQRRQDPRSAQIRRASNEQILRHF